MSEKEDYVTLKIPHELAEAIDRIIGKMGFRTRAEFVKEAIRQLLKEYKPDLEHFNLDENGVKILDRNIGRTGWVVDIHFKPDVIYCEYCLSDKCKHVKFALTIPQVRNIIKKKGWIKLLEKYDSLITQE